MVRKTRFENGWFTVYELIFCNYSKNVFDNKISEILDLCYVDSFN